MEREAITEHGGGPGVSGQDMRASFPVVRVVICSYYSCPSFPLLSLPLHSILLQKESVYRFSKGPVYRLVVKRTPGIAFGEIDICRSFPKSSDPAVLEFGQGIGLSQILLGELVEEPDSSL